MCPLRRVYACTIFLPHPHNILDTMCTIVSLEGKGYLAYGGLGSEWLNYLLRLSENTNFTRITAVKYKTVKIKNISKHRGLKYQPYFFLIRWFYVQYNSTHSCVGKLSIQICYGICDIQCTANHFLPKIFVFRWKRIFLAIKEHKYGLVGMLCNYKNPSMDVSMSLLLLYI